MKKNRQYTDELKEIGSRRQAILEMDHYVAEIQDKLDEAMKDKNKMQLKVEELDNQVDRLTKVIAEKDVQLDALNLKITTQEKRENESVQEIGMFKETMNRVMSLLTKNRES